MSEDPDNPDDGFKIGLNAKDNTNLVKQASQQDLWFHVQNGTSAHVILTHDQISPDTISAAAHACKSHSKFKHVRKVKIMYCEVKNLKAGSKPGQVLIKSNKKCKVILV